MGVSILSDGCVWKRFSVRPAADDDLICPNAWNECIHCQWWGVGKPLSMRPAADDDLKLTLETLEQGVKYVQS